MSEDRSLVPASEGQMALGQTNLRPQDIVFPRIKIIQQMSQENTDGVAPAGDFYNVLTGESYGTKLRIQPILPFMQRVFLTRAGEKRDRADEQLAAVNLPTLSDGDGLKCRSLDMVKGNGEPGVLCEAVCPLSEWTRDSKGKQLAPLCTETYNVAAANELGELVILSFSRSSAKVGKRFFSAIRMGAGQAAWTRFYDLETTKVQNDLGTFFVPNFKIAGGDDRPDSALIAQAVHWAEQLKGVRADQIDVTPDEEPGDRGDDLEGGGSEPSGDDPF